MAIRKEVLDELLKDYKGPEDLTGEEGVLKQLTKALVERAMGAQLSDHLAYQKNEAGVKVGENRRDGSSEKRLRSDQGPITVEVPRDRDGSFEPKIVGKHQREMPGFSDKILSMYARGMSTREIGAHLQKIYGTEVSHSSSRASLMRWWRPWIRGATASWMPCIRSCSLTRSW